MAAKKKAKTKAAGQSKTEFVLAFSKDVTANEVSEKAKEAGLDIKPGYVYEIRSAANRKARGVKRTYTSRTSPKKRHHSGLNGHTEKAEGLLRNVASLIGLSRSMEILQEQCDQVMGILD